MCRRLSRHYEHWDIFSEAMVYLASIQSLLRRMAPNAMTATTSAPEPHELPKRPLRI